MVLLLLGLLDERPRRVLDGNGSSDSDGDGDDKARNGATNGSSTSKRKRRWSRTFLLSEVIPLLGDELMPNSQDGGNENGLMVAVDRGVK